MLLWPHISLLLLLLLWEALSSPVVVWKHWSSSREIHVVRLLHHGGVVR